MFRFPLPYYVACLLSAIVRLFVKENWKAKGEAKKKSVESLIPTEWLLPLSITSKISETSSTNVLDIPKQSGLLDEVELEITENYTAAELLEEIRKGTYSSLQVTTAFCKRAAIAHQLTNCCTEFMFDLAFVRARELDQYYKSTGKTLGPLHGLPVSIKDTFNVPGFDSAIGFVSFIGNKQHITEPSNLVQMLLDMGAVLYVKTNIPQTLMTPDSDNHVMGRCLNPLNTSLTAGGSSGGESSLIKQRGSILGVGTDVGGSLRIPSVCCGTYSMKPSADRIPFGKQTAPGAKDAQGFRILPALGPIANSFYDLEFFCKSMVLKEPWNYDSQVIPVPWKENILGDRKKLRIGVIVEDKSFPVHPPIKRIIQEVTAKLATNHELIILENFPSYVENWQCCLNYFALNNTKETFKNICRSGEPPIKSIATNGAEFFGLPPVTLNGVSKLMLHREKIINDWNQLFIDNKLDVILSPGASWTAPPHDTYGIAPYTAAWNLTNFPCCIIPYGKVEDCDKNNLFETVKGDYSFLGAQYDQLKYAGGTGHFQLTCRYMEEEKLLSVGKIIDDDLHH